MKIQNLMSSLILGGALIVMAQQAQAQVDSTWTVNNNSLMTFTIQLVTTDADFTKCKLSELKGNSNMTCGLFTTSDGLGKMILTSGDNVCTISFKTNVQTQTTSANCTGTGNLSITPASTSGKRDDNQTYTITSPGT